MVDMLMGFFRKGDFLNPKIFASGLAANFQLFPIAVCKEVIDPIDGLPVLLKFPPTIAEVRDALDAAMAKRRAINARAHAIVAEHERRALPEQKPTLSPEDRSRIVANLLGPRRMDGTTVAAE